MNRITACAIAITCTITTTYSAESSTEVGYNDGFILGQARHDKKAEGLDARGIELLSSMNSESHAKGGQGRSAADYKAGWQKGYTDGFAGKAKGGGVQAPLPELPITIAREPNHSYKDLGECKSNAPFESLAALTKEFKDKDLFIIDAKVKSNSNFTDYVRLVHDRKERIYLKLKRLVTPDKDSTHDWVLKFDMGEDELTEQKLWETEDKHRAVRSKFNDARTSIPLKYTKNVKLTEWP